MINLQSTGKRSNKKLKMTQLAQDLVIVKKWSACSLRLEMGVGICRDQTKSHRGSYFFRAGICKRNELGGTRIMVSFLCFWSNSGGMLNRQEV